MVSDLDIWRSAQAMVKRYGDEAAHESSKRAAELEALKDEAGAAAWRRIASAVEELQNVKPPKDRPLH